MADAFAQVTRPPGTGQPALLGRAGQRHGQPGRGLPRAHAPDRHRGAAAPRAGDRGAVPRQPRGDDDAEAVGEVVLRAGPRRGRTRGVHAGLRDGAAAARGPGVPVDPAGRLEPAAGRPRPVRTVSEPRTPPTRERLRLFADRITASRVPPWSSGRRWTAAGGWEAAVALAEKLQRRRLRRAARGPRLVPRGPPALPGPARHVAEGHQRPAGRARPGGRDRRRGVPVLPVRARRHPARPAPNCCRSPPTPGSPRPPGWATASSATPRRRSSCSWSMVDGGISARDRPSRWRGPASCRRRRAARSPRRRSTRRSSGVRPPHAVIVNESTSTMAPARRVAAHGQEPDRSSPRPAAASAGPARPPSASRSATGTRASSGR